MELPPDVTSAISNKKWYRQRFDGSPLFIYSIAEAELKQEDRKPAGTEADIRVCFFSDGKADWYLDMADINRGAQVLSDLAKDNTDISTKLLANWKEDEDEFKRFYQKEFSLIQLVELSNDELAGLWSRIATLFSNRATSSSIIDHFALGTDLLISDMLQEEVGAPERKSDFTRIFSTATAPVHLSFINQAEIDLLKIATGKSDQSLEDYQKQYFWTNNNYVLAQELSVDHFQEEIDSWNESGKDLNEEMRRIESTPDKNKQQKQDLLNELDLSQHLLTLLKISEDFTWWQDERKKATYLNIHMGSKLLEEISRRIGFPVEPMKYAFWPEIDSLVKEKKPSVNELKARREFCVFIWTRDNTIIKTGDEAKRVHEMMFGEDTKDEIQDIRGLSASTGKATGTARIVSSATEMGKVEHGDILIAVMTRPDYVPAMKKAAAIVTDEGGVTSHAAIVSRELGIPCIIGTKIATSVFKDGDQIEVNANHGWVRKIQIVQ
ncbi:MAG: PEP-utilizing enzyme [Candidatus Kerfeldbacteria bacterium]